MIRISPLIQELLQRPTVSSFYLMKTEGGLRKTTYPYDLEFLNETYESDGSIVQIELPKMTSVVDKQKFKIVMADNYLDFAAIAENNLVGQEVSVWMSLVDLETDKPVLTANDVVLIYRGAIDAPAHQINTAEVGSVMFSMDCASPMADLDRVRTYYASQDYADKNHPGDTSYEQIFQGSGPVAARWGRS